MSQAGKYILGAGGAPIETITGNAGGPVPPDATGDIDLLGTNPITVTGTPALNRLDITIANASETQIGAVELATAAETTTGTSTALAVHPAGLNTKLGTQTLNGLIYGQGGAGTNLGSLAAATNGQLPIGNTGNPPTLSTLTAGAGVTILNGAGSITISSTGSFTWNEVVVIGPTAMAVNNGYIANNAGQVVLLLPAVAALGSTVRVAGKGTGGWQITQNAGQIIHFGNQDTLAGVGGSLTTTNRYDCVELLCTTANLDFTVLSVIGNLTVV